MGKHKITINDNLKETYISSNIVSINGKRTPAVMAWYKTAEDNLFSAKILLENASISHAVFFIQQSIECAVKGLFLEAGIFKEENIKKEIKHYPSETFLSLYEKIDYEDGKEYCQIIPEMLNKKSIFQDKLILAISLANQITDGFKKELSKIFTNQILEQFSHPEVLGLPSYATNQAIQYSVKESLYVQNILLLFSCLFTHEIESTARYFNNNNNVIVYPNDIYNTPIIVARLPSVVKLINSIIKRLIGFPSTEPI